MTFEDALTAMKAGKRITRAFWRGKPESEATVSIREMEEGQTPVKTRSYDERVYTASPADMLAEDWCIVGEEYFFRASDALTRARLAFTCAFPPLGPEILEARVHFKALHELLTAKLEGPPPSPELLATLALNRPIEPQQ